MDQVKIGRFIAKCRKDKNLTQEQLAEKFGISDRAVSKWERGLNLPDASIMIELCNILGINVNELFTGEMIKKENYMKQAEENLIELKKQNEAHAKRLLMLEWVITIISLISFFIMLYVGIEVVKETVWQIVLIVGAISILIICAVFAILIEQVAGYYECRKCHHRYIPTYFQVFMAMHCGRTRYMKCPRCNKRSWNKKVLTK